VGAGQEQGMTEGVCGNTGQEDGASFLGAQVVASPLMRERGLLHNLKSNMLISSLMFNLILNLNK